MNESSSQPMKRLRLSLACNECRRRKVKCDAGHPKCRNCEARNSECITTNLRRPGSEVRREWLDVTQESSPSQDGGHSPRRSSPPSVTPRRQMMTSIPGTATDLSLPHLALSGRSAVVNAPSMEPSAHPTYEMPLVREPSNGGSTTDRVKLLGGSSSQSLTRSLDVYLKSANIQPVSSGFRHGMRFVEEMEISLTLSLPLLPTLQRCELLLDIFVQRIYPLYPIFDLDSFRDGFRKLALMATFELLSHDEIPILASAYLVMSLCIDEEAQKSTEEGLKYLQAATSLLGHVILIPYLNAVQALILSTVCFRGRNKDGVGWRTLAMAIRISQTLGLHRETAAPNSIHERHSRENFSVRERIWVICCSLEKVMQLEVGWPSMVKDFGCDRVPSESPHDRGYKFLTPFMGLAQIQGRISNHIYGHSPGDRSSREILLDTNKLDRELQSWAHSLPESLRPGSDIFVADHELPIAAFLSTQYYQTMISLHRAALVTPNLSFRSEVDMYFSQDASRLRLQSGETICVSSAKAIASLAIELSDRNIESRLLNAGPNLLACVVLGISLVKNPGRRMQATDIELFKACVEFTAVQFQQAGQHPEFVKGIRFIYTQVFEYISSRSQPSLRQEDLINFNGRGISGQADAPSTRSHQESTVIERNFTNADITSDHDVISSINTGIALTENTSLQHQQVTVPNQAYEQVDLHAELSEPMRSDVDHYDQNLETQDMYSNTEPFGNLSIEEIWNWMLIADLDDIASTAGH